MNSTSSVNVNTAKEMPMNVICACKEFVVRMIKRIEKTISMIAIMILIVLRRGWRVRFKAPVAIFAKAEPMLRAPNMMHSNLISISTKIKIAPIATMATAITRL